MRLPRPLLRQLNRRARALPPGQHLDEQVAAALAVHGRFGPRSLEHYDPTHARVVYARGIAPFQPRARPMADVRDLTVTIPNPASGPDTTLLARAYRPHGARDGGPAILYYHGGGGVIGSVDLYDRPCRIIADDTGFVVISLEYRLAPEAPFPAAVEDAIGAFLWLQKHPDQLELGVAIDPARVIVAGDSMGGNLAAVASQALREHDVPSPALQVLLYPALDFTMQHASHREFADGYLLTHQLMTWFRSHYLTDESQRLDIRASPLLADDVNGLPPALIITAGFDPLRDEGCRYAERLTEAGVTVRYRCEHSLIHGYINTLGLIAASRRALEQMNRDIRELIEPSAPAAG